ncbi:MAG: type III-B CRISPR module RAMP protein Cmr1 [Melioribacteraceae bacterium]|nr:type III-B CRISPR module RAMP protein Cmr1 [Melioribacteraceae bacterium]
MEKITFQCETITPMFLAGADGKTPELRPPSIKAAMRFWWRAMNGHLSLKDLKEKESEIFGGSGENEGRSKFSIRIKPIIEKEEDNLKVKLWDNKNNSVKSDFEGQGYLLYSKIMQKDNLPSYFSKTSFDVILSSHDKKIISEAATTFYYLSVFGSLGSRSRRGAGNFLIKEINDPERLFKKFELPDNLKNKSGIEVYLKQLLQDVNVKNNNNYNNNTFSNLTSASIFILDSQNSVEKCFELFGKTYKNFRSRSEPDYSTVKEYLRNGNISDNSTIEKAAMGLPINYRYRSLKGKSATIEGSVKKERERSASPLIFKIFPIKNGSNFEYYPLVIYFIRELLPNSEKIKLKDTNKKGQKPKLLNVPSNKIIEDFLSQLPNATEVTL